MSAATTPPHTPFSLPVRVYWEDTDAGGVVFYANYLKFFERARTEWLRRLGLNQHTLREQTGGMFVVSSAQIKSTSQRGWMICSPLPHISSSLAKPAWCLHKKPIAILTLPIPPTARCWLRAVFALAGSMPKPCSQGAFLLLCWQRCKPLVTCTQAKEALFYSSNKKKPRKIVIPAQE